jgi:signal transduction histidine kinase
MLLPIPLRLMACFGQATLALVSLRASGPLALPLTLISTDLLIWNFASFAQATSGRALWHIINCSTSPFTVSFGLDFILVFVGRRRSLRHFLAAIYVVSSVLSASYLVHPLRTLSRFALPDPIWNAVFLLEIVIGIVTTLVLLVVHEREVAVVEEKRRTLVLLAALPLSAVLGASGLINDFIPAVPRVSHLGTLVCAGFMSAVAFRWRLFGRGLGRGTAAASLSLALLGVVAYCAVLRIFTTRTTLLVGSAAVVAVILFACIRKFSEQARARREERSKLAVAGRVWAQMAHDLKNPLAALQGAIQFLEEERRQGRSMDAHADFLDLIGDQIRKMVGIVDGFDPRAGAGSSATNSVDLAQLLREIAALSEHAVQQVTIRTELAEPLPTYRGDRELLARVLQNLVGNALEAMPNGGELTLTATPTPIDTTTAVTITIADTGEGMDARTRERAFDDFFTTKLRGTGLGLSFVRRVVEARGGRVLLRSALGRGTTVSLQIPVA